MPDRVGRSPLASQHERLRPAALTGSDLLHCAAGGHGSIFVGNRIATFALAAIAMLDQEPVIAVAAAVLPVMSHPHQNPASLQFFTRKCEVQISFMERPFGIPTVFGRPEASVPEQDGTAPVFTLRDRPFEVPVVEWVILDLHCQPAVARIERWP